MKRTVNAALCFVLILGLLCTLAACSEDITGRYELISVAMNEESFTVQELKDYIGDQEDMYLELRSDGTGTLVYLRSTSEMLWEDNMIWPVKSTTKATFTVEGNTLTMNMNSVILVFQK